MPPSTKAAGDVKLSILAFSSVSDAIAKVSQPDIKSIKQVCTESTTELSSKEEACPVIHYALRKQARP
jgi:hypothetical protein